MSHARTAIRDAFFEAVDGLTTTGDRAFKSRKMPSGDEYLPGLLVYTDFEEIVEDEENVSSVQTRNLLIIVKGHDKLNAGLDDQLDIIAAEVETAVFAASIPNIYALDLVGTDLETEDGAEKDVGEVELTFRVQYLTQKGAPNTAL